jgi:hypothetical protein
MLRPEKLRALSGEQIWDLTLRTAAVQSRLIQLPPDPNPEDRELIRLLAEALLLFEHELRRRDLEAQLTFGLAIEELDPELVADEP